MSLLPYFGIQGWSNIQLVGAKTMSVSDFESGASLDLTDLSKGVDTGISAAAGDLVIVAGAIGAGSGDDYNFNMVTSGYTEIADLFSNDSRSTNLGVFRKVLGGSPDSSAVVNISSALGTQTGAALAYVFRSVHASSPVSSQSATGQNSVLANPPSITPGNPGSVIVAIGAGGHSTGSATEYTASALTHFVSDGEGGGTGTVIGAGSYFGWGSGAYDPAAWTFGASDNSSYSWAAVTLALRPA